MNHTIRLIFLLPAFITWMTPTAVFSRDIAKFRHITPRDGLSHSTVYSVARDSHGFMWFGTENGLNRYDGYRIVEFKHDADNPNSLSSNNAGNLFIDRAGTIWIGTWGGGLIQFDPENKKFTHFRHDPGDESSIGDDRVQSVFRDRSGFVWAGTRNGGLNRLDVRSGKFKQYRHQPDDPDSISSDYIWAIYEDALGILWIGTDGGGAGKYGTGTPYHL